MRPIILSVMFALLMCFVILALFAFITWSVPSLDWALIRALAAIGFFIGIPIAIHEWLEKRP